MRQPLILAVAQPVVEPHDLAANAHRHADAVDEARARVVVFPELSLTGYELDAAPVALDDPALAPLIEACDRTGSLALAGAVVAEGDGQEHIAVVAVDETSTRIGPRVVYRKMWLAEAEAERFGAGTRPGLIEVDGWRLGLAVCRDTGIADHAAATAALGIDVYAAGVLERAADRDVQPDRARRVAANHGVWVAMASYAGSAGGGYDPAAGGSGIWRPDGSEAARAGDAPGEVVTARIGG
jgi:predicted amidohydrolase